MIKVELLAEKPIVLQLLEAQQVSLGVSPLAGTIKGRDAYSPYIGEYGTWMCWNDDDGQWIDTGVKAAGEKGDPGEALVPDLDVIVTAEVIHNALGYLPARKEDIPVIVTLTQEEYNALPAKDERTIYIIAGGDTP